MDKVKVVVMTPVSDESLKLIAGVSPRVNMIVASDLFRQERKGDAEAGKKLDAILADAEVVFGRFELEQNVTTRAPKLKWIQTMGAGVNRYLTKELIQSPIVMTNASGIHATPIGEYIVTMMLMLTKDIPLYYQRQQKKEWKKTDVGVLRDKTVGIVGLGNIGREAARLSKAFGAKVVSMHRSAKVGERARYVDIMLPRERLTELLKQCDFVVLSVPLTAETKNLISERELRAMKPSAYLINIARGDIVDEPVLIRALKEHWIAGAALDVFSKEPLPKESELWELPNVILTPHVAAQTPEQDWLATQLFADNLRRYLQGKRLRNIVNKQRGY